jgi:HemY protein
MIRVVLFLVAVGLAATAAVLLAEQPGQVSITWLGYHAEPPVPLLILAIAVVSIVVWPVLLMLVRAPRRIASGVRRRRAARGRHAITRGLIAVGAGDLKTARRFAGEAKRYAGDEPLALLLGAQAAQLAGNRPAAEGIFRQMADQSATRMLGLHGLFVEAQRRRDLPAARAIAEEAVDNNPAAGWAAQAVLDARCGEHDWAGALVALDSNLKSGLADKAGFRRSRAVLLTARALSGADRDAARADVLEAVKLAPGLVPAAALAGRLLAEAGETRKAGRVLEAAWRLNPHPDLAETYAHVRPGDSARDRLARVQSLARQRGEDAEGKLAVARAAIDAREFAAARAALASFTASPTRRVALMMAEIEEFDSGDVGRARQWTARAVNAAHDPAWTADGLVSDKWLPVSPATGRLDAFQWKVPLADLNPPGPMIEQANVAAVAAPAPAPEPPPEPAPVRVVEPAPARVVDTAPAPSAPHDEGDVDDAPGVAAASPPELVPAAPRQEVILPAVVPRRMTIEDAHRVDAVIPLVHSPDDPGPDGELAEEPAPTSPASEPWWRRSRFR